METSILTRTLSFIVIMASAVAPRTFAQAGPTLDIQLYAGVTITGAVGTVHTVEYVTDLAQTNSPGAWRCLEFVRLPASPFLWTDKSTPAAAKRFYRAVVFPSPTNMVFIPPGTFRMGSPTNEIDRWEDEGPQTDVIISRGFWMGQYEVTQAEYLSVMGTNPSLLTGDLHLPVDSVSWSDATNYCAKLTQQWRAAGWIRTDCAYRLPTEAEWEYACRAWTSTRFSYGDDPGYTNLTDYAWYFHNSGLRTHPVGQKLPNAWGLFDLHGNVHEWCHDWYGTYAGGTLIDPEGPASGPYHVIRGGNFNPTGLGCRSAVRPSNPDFRYHYIGLRIVLAPDVK